VRIFLADDEAPVRSALRLLLEQEPGLAVVGEAGAADQAVAAVAAMRPQLVLLDWHLAGRDGRALVKRLHAAAGKIIVLSGRPEDRAAAQAAGADAFVSKGDPPERLLAAVRDALA
jgi:DNA-binding NarL/FixJ family response regulator